MKPQPKEPHYNDGGLIVPRLESQRILLRAFTQGDIALCYQWFNDPNVTHYMNKGYTVNTEATQWAFFEKISESETDLQLAITDKGNGTLIGTVGLHKIDWRHRRGDVSIMIGHADYWKQGYASEVIGMLVDYAFSKLNFRKITAGVWSPNIGCQKAFEKNGFSIEGNLKEQFLCDGEFVSQVCYGLIRADWNSEKSSQERDSL